MRRAWLSALAATLPPTALAQDQQSPPGIVIRDFSVTDSPCRYKHDGAVEEALQTVRIVTNAAKSSPDGQVATVELRNKAAKTITAYVLNYTFAHNGKTDYYDGHGVDLVYEMAVSKQNPEQTTFLPGVVIKQEIAGQRGHGQFEVFPCMVGFEDGTFTGPHSLWEFLVQMRGENAKAFSALVADLQSAHDASDPKTFLVNRAKQVKKTSRGTSGDEPYRYLEIVASGLSLSGNTLLDRKAIADSISALQAEQEFLVKQSSWVAARANQTGSTQPKVIFLPHGEVSHISSPDGKWALIFECPNNCSERKLWIEETSKHSRKLVKEYGRSLDISWAPDSQLFFVNDNSGSTDARCYVYEAASLKETDLAKSVLAGDPDASQFLDAGHSYLRAKRWLNTHELLVVLTGHHDGLPPGAFTLRYRVDLRGKVRKLSQRSEEQP